jgi:hypothetical protein
MRIFRWLTATAFLVLTGCGETSQSESLLSPSGPAKASGISGYYTVQIMLWGPSGNGEVIPNGLNPDQQCTFLAYITDPNGNQVSALEMREVFWNGAGISPSEGYGVQEGVEVQPGGSFTTSWGAYDFDLKVYVEDWNGNTGNDAASVAVSQPGYGSDCISAI